MGSKEAVGRRKTTVEVESGPALSSRLPPVCC